MRTEESAKSPNGADDGDPAPVEQPVYQIRVQSHLSGQWADLFEGLTVRQEKDGSTVLTGPLVDQAALHGLLCRIRDLCLPLVSVNRVAQPSCGSGQSAVEE